jgi:hypothetical protein
MDQHHLPKNEALFLRAGPRRLGLRVVGEKSPVSPRMFDRSQGEESAEVNRSSRSRIAIQTAQVQHNICRNRSGRPSWTLKTASKRAALLAETL